MKSIVIIGAGITGVTTAYTLAQRGYAVTVLDRRRYPAMETSFANGGQLSASNAEVWNSWSNIFHGLANMHRPDTPLLLSPLPNWHKYSWLAEFVRHIPNYRHNTIATTRLAVRARQLLFDIAAKENIEFDLERRGILHVYHDRTGFKHAEQVNSMLCEGGLVRRAVTPQEIRNIEPAIQGKYFGGFFTADDATGDIHKFTSGLAKACSTIGVRFIQDTDVQRIRHTPNGVEILLNNALAEHAVDDCLFTDGVVVCAGVESRRLASSLGDRVNIYPVKGYSITVSLPDEDSRRAAPWVSILDDKAKIVTSRLGAGRFRVAGTAELNGYNYDIRADRIAPLVSWVRKEFPGINTGATIPWCGLRPMMPNMMPRVGWGRRPGIFYNTGHGHLGWTLAAATAELTAQSIFDVLPAQ